MSASDVHVLKQAKSLKEQLVRKVALPRTPNPEGTVTVALRVDGAVVIVEFAKGVMIEVVVIFGIPAEELLFVVLLA